MSSKDLIVNIKVDTKKAAKNLKSLGSNLESTNSNFKNLRKQLKAIESQLKISAKLTDEVNNSTRKFKTTLSNTPVNSFGSSLKGLGLNIISLNQGFELLGRGVAAFKRGFDSTLGNFSKFEASLVGVSKTTGLSGDALQSLGSNFQSLSEEIPVSTNELLGLAQSAGQLGVKGKENLENFAITVAKLARSSDLTGEVAATALTRILNVTGENISEIDELASVIVALGNNFAATESEITKVANELARSTAQFKLNSASVAGIATALKAMGTQAQLGGSVVGKTFRTIDKAIREGSEGFRNLQKITKLSGEELTKTFKTDAVAVFRAFINGLSDVNKSGASVSAVLETLGLSGDEVNKVLPSLATNARVLNSALDLSAKELKETSALNNEAAKAFATLKSDIDRLGNSAKNLATQIGSFLVPIFKPLIKSLTESLSSIKEFIKTLQVNNFEKLKNNLVALSALFISFGIAVKIHAAGSLLLFAQSIGLTLIKPLIFLGLKLVTLTGGFSALAAAATAVAIPMAIVTAKIVLISGVVLGVASAIELLIRKFQGLGIAGSLTEKAFNGLKNLFTSFKEESFDVAKPAIKSMGKLEKNIINNIKLAKEQQAQSKALKKEQSKDVQNLIKGIIKANKSLQLGIDNTGASSIDQIKNQLLFNLKAIDLRKKELQSQNLLTKEVQKQLDMSKTLLKIQATKKIELEAAEKLADLTSKRKDILKELLKSNSELQNSNLKSISSQKDAVQNTLKSQLKALAVKEAELTKQNLLTKAIQEELDKRKDLLKTQASNEIAKIDNKELKDRQKIVAELGAVLKDLNTESFKSKEIAKLELDTKLKDLDILEQKLLKQKEFTKIAADGTAILNNSAAETLRLAKEQANIEFNEKTKITFESETKAVTDSINNFAAPFTGALGAASGMIDAVQGLVDLVPNFLNKFSSLLDSITALPERLVKSFDALIKSVVNIISELIPNIARAIPSLISAIFSELPEAIIKAVDGLFKAFPKIVDNLITALINMLPKLVSGLISQMPRLTASFTIGLVKAVPKITMSLIKAMPEVAMALVNGIIDGLGSLVSMLFGGDDQAIQQAEAVTEVFNNGVTLLAEKSTKEASNLFRVADDTKLARGNKTALEIEQSLNRATTKLSTDFRNETNFLKQTWDTIVGLWNAAIAAPLAIFKFIGKMLMGVWDAAKAIFNVIIDAFKGIWNFIKVIFNAIIDTFKGLWEGVKGIFNVIIDALKSVWDGVEIVFAKIVFAVRSVFLWVWKNVFKPIVDAIGSIIGFIGDIGGSIADGAKSIVKSVTSFFGFSEGGLVQGGVQGKDSVPSMLMPNEFVLRASAVKKLGLDNLVQLNKGIIPNNFSNQESRGTPSINNVITNKVNGAVSQPIINNYNIELGINLNANGKVDESYLKNKLIPTLKKELKTASLRGEFILSNRGLRA